VGGGAKDLIEDKTTKHRHSKKPPWKKNAVKFVCGSRCGKVRLREPHRTRNDLDIKVGKSEKERPGSGERLKHKKALYRRREKRERLLGVVGSRRIVLDGGYTEKKLVGEHLRRWGRISRKRRRRKERRSTLRRSVQQETDTIKSNGAQHSNT